MLTVTDLYTARGLALKSKGRNSRGAEFAGPCPLCGGRDRFLVWPEQNDGRGSYSCRQCGISGDVIQWLMDVEGMTFRQAAQAADAAEDAAPEEQPAEDSEDEPMTSADVEAAEQAVVEDAPWYIRMLDALFFYQGAEGQSVASTGE